MVGFVVNGEVTHLSAGPFVNFDDAYAWFNDNGQDGLAILKTSLPFSVEVVQQGRIRC